MAQSRCQVYRDSEWFQRRLSQPDYLHTDTFRISLKHCDYREDYAEQEDHSSDNETESYSSEIDDDDRYILEKELERCQDEIACLKAKLCESKNKCQQNLSRFRIWIRHQVKENDIYIEKISNLTEKNKSLRMKLRSQSELLNEKNAKLINEWYVYMFEKENELSLLSSQLNHARKELERTKTELRKTKEERDLQCSRAYYTETGTERKNLETRLPPQFTYMMIDNKIYGYGFKPLQTEESNMLFAERSRQTFTKVKDRTPERGITQFEKQRRFEENNERNKENVSQIKRLKVEVQKLEKELESRDLTLKQQEKMLKERESTRHENIKLYNQLELKESKVRQLNEHVAVYTRKIKELEDLLRKTGEAGVRETDLPQDLKKRDDKISEQRNQLKANVTRLKELEAQLEETTSDRDSERKRRQDLERKTKQLETRIQELERENDKADTLQRQKIERLQKDLDQRNLIKKDVTVRMATGTSDTEKERELRRELKSKEDILSEQKIYLQQVLSKLKETEAKLLRKTGEAGVTETDLRQEIKKSDDKLSEQRNQLKANVTRLKELEAQLKETTSDRDSERKRRQDLERKTKQIETRIQELEQENDKAANLQRQKIERLQKDLDQRNSIKEDVTVRMATRTAETEKERELRRELKIKDDKLFEQSIHLQQVLSTLEDTEAKLANIERDFERRSKQLLDEKDKVSKMKIKDLERANDLTANEQNKKIKQLQDDLENRDKKVKELEERLRNTKTEGLIRNDFGNASSQKEKMISKLEDQLNQALIKLKRTETELEETKTRLSKSLGDKLTDNNPNVADLSDKNRPVKLAERYGELYDNQWTDAFEILNKYYDNEENTIIALLEILKDVMDFCKSTGSKQMKDLQSILGFSGIPVEDIPTDVRKHLKDCRKAMGLITVRNLYEEYLSHLKRSAHEKLKKASEVPAYVRECLELCWLMVIQDPPVVLAPVAKQGSRLNIDLFKPYTRTGPFVEFTVWPALLLHDGGPVLAKGVAQGVGT